MNNKLLAIQSELKAPKGQFNSFGKYYYRNCEDILEAVKPLLAKHGATLTISDEIVAVGNRVYVKSTALLSDGASGLGCVTAFARESEEKKGMDSAQVTGAASSYARKYALNGLFLIDDTKDSDHTNTHDKQAPTVVNRPNPVPAPQKPVEVPVATIKTVEPPANDGLDSFRRDNNPNVDEEGFMGIDDAVKVTSADMDIELKDGQHIVEGILTKYYPPQIGKTGKPGPFTAYVNKMAMKSFSHDFRDLLSKMEGQVVKLVYSTKEYNGKEQYTIEEVI